MKAKRVEISLKELITQRVKAENPRTVRDLFRIVKERRPTLAEEEFIQSIKELKDSGKLELELPPPKVDSYLAYLTVSSENAWFHPLVVASDTHSWAKAVVPLACERVAYDRVSAVETFSLTIAKVPTKR